MKRQCPYAIYEYLCEKSNCLDCSIRLEALAKAVEVYDKAVRDAAKVGDSALKEVNNERHPAGENTGDYY